MYEGDHPFSVRKYMYGTTYYTTLWYVLSTTTLKLCGYVCAEKTSYLRIRLVYHYIQSNLLSRYLEVRGVQLADEEDGNYTK